MDRVRDAVQSIQVQGGLNGQGGRGGPGRTVWRSAVVEDLAGPLAAEASVGSEAAVASAARRRRRRRRTRQLPRLQSRPAARRHLLERNQLGDQCAAVRSAGQPQEQPPNGTNRFGITFMSAPYIPHLTKPSGKDTVFLTLSGTRSSNPDDFTPRCPPMRSAAAIFPPPACRRSTIPSPASSSFTTAHPM